MPTRTHAAGNEPSTRSGWPCKAAMLPQCPPEFKRDHAVTRLCKLLGTCHGAVTAEVANTIIPRIELNHRES